MKKCVSCEQPFEFGISSPSRDFCGRCYWNLPAVTRAAYQRDPQRLKQVTRASRDARASIKMFGGGKR